MSPKTFDERVEARFEHISPAERRVARYFQMNREEVLIASAAALAAKADTSDATIVRASKSLGFSGLDDLRRSIADELRQSSSPSERLVRTLDEVGDSLPAAFTVTLQTQLQSLESLGRLITAGMFERAVTMIATGRRVVVFGLGPSSAIATYMAVQLGRFGIDTVSITNSGLLFADDIRKLRDGDTIVILAYGRVYGELAVLLEEIVRREFASILLTDTLAGRLVKHVDLVLPVPRGRADMFSMHTATLGLIETLLVGVAQQRPSETLASLERLDAIRQKLAGRSTELPLPAAKPRRPITRQPDDAG